MNRLAKSPLTKAIAAGLALTLLGSSAASAAPWGGHREHWDRGYHRDWHGHQDTALAIGAGILALGLIGAVASSHEAPPQPRYYAPPPPPPSYGYGYDRSYGDRYGY